MPNLTFDLRYIRCAFSAAELGSFRRVAAALELPQSTVSRRIQLLERRLGFPLFERGRGGVKLTPTGASFLRNAIEGAHQLDRAAKLATAVHRGERGELRVGILAFLVSGFLPQVLHQFRKRHPDVRLVLREGSLVETLHGLSMGDLDIAFVTGCPDLPGCTAQVLWKDSVYAVLPKGHGLERRTTIHWDDICGENFIVTHGGAGVEIQDYLIRKLSRPGFRPRIDVHDVSHGSLLDLVAMNYGITLFSASSFRRDDECVLFRLIAGEVEVLPSSAVWSMTNANTALRHMLKLTEDIDCDNLDKARPFVV